MSNCACRKRGVREDDEEDEYVRSIIEDVKWLGFDWKDRMYFASNYFDQMYEYALKLIRSGNAYVCDLTGDEIRKNRGTLKDLGLESPFRSREIEENLDLFKKMKEGEFKEGECVLRAKIDMSSSFMCMRDPTLYRIRFETHHQTNNDWCILSLIHI